MSDLELLASMSVPELPAPRPRKEKSPGKVKGGNARTEAYGKMSLLAARCGQCGCPATKASKLRGTPLCRHHDPEHVSPSRLKKQHDGVDRQGLAYELAEAVSYARELSRGPRSGVMPLDNLENYETVLMDEHIVELKDDIATIESRIQQLLKALKDDPRNSGAFMKTISGILTDYDRQIQIGSATPEKALKEIREVIDEAGKQRAVWSEILKFTEQKRKLVETETKRMKDIGWTPDYVHAIFVEVSQIIKQLTDQATSVLFVERLLQSPLLVNQQVKLLPSTGALASGEHTQGD